MSREFSIDWPGWSDYPPPGPTISRRCEVHHDVGDLALTTAYYDDGEVLIGYWDDTMNEGSWTARWDKIQAKWVPIESEADEPLVVEAK